MNPFTIGPALIGRALDDLSAIADAARGLASLEAAVVRIEAQLEGLREDIGGLRAEMRPIREIAEVRRGIEPLDDDMRAVRESVKDLEPLLRQVNAQLGGLDGRIETLREDLAPLGDLADKIPGVGGRG